MPFRCSRILVLLRTISPHPPHIPPITLMPPGPLGAAIHAGAAEGSAGPHRDAARGRLLDRPHQIPLLRHGEPEGAWGLCGTLWGLCDVSMGLYGVSAGSLWGSLGLCGVSRGIYGGMMFRMFRNTLNNCLYQENQ